MLQPRRRRRSTRQLPPRAAHPTMVIQLLELPSRLLRHPRVVHVAADFGSGCVVHRPVAGRVADFQIDVITEVGLEEQMENVDAVVETRPVHQGVVV